MSAASDRRLRERSKRLFGNSYMLEVCLAIGDAEDRVSLSELAERKSLAPSLYSGPIARLVALGLLVDAPRATDDYRARWYSAIPSGLWTTAHEVATPPRKR